MLVEVCAYSVESCLNAERAGAGRIELCGGPGEGGTTPSPGLIGTVRRYVRIPVYVMIRPRGGDFVYDDLEEETMRADIRMAVAAGADGIVTGILREDGRVDIERTARLASAAGGLGFTFHRAFDLTPDPLQALEDIIRTGAERILTSGQKPSAPMGAELLGKLAAAARGRIEIMAGGGVNSSNAAMLIATGVDCLHLTGKAFRPGKQRFFPEGISMAGGQPDERSVMYSDAALILPVVQAADRNN